MFENAMVSPLRRLLQIRGPIFNKQTPESPTATNICLMESKHLKLRPQLYSASIISSILQENLFLFSLFTNDIHGYLDIDMLSA